MRKRQSTRLVLVSDRFMGGEMRPPGTAIAEVTPLGRFTENELAKALCGGVRLEEARPAEMEVRETAPAEAATG